MRSGAAVLLPLRHSACWATTTVSACREDTTADTFKSDVDLTLQSFGLLL